MDTLERPAAVTAQQRAEIEAQRATEMPTRRATVPAMEALLYQPIPVLDHGFIRVIDYMGDDASIVQAARVSYGAGTKKVREDAGLINYLMRHRHTSPFEMCEIKLHVKLPIFVARQWIRHRTACLAGGTKLYFDLPNGLKRGGRARSTMTLERFHREWHEGSSHPIVKKKPTYLEDVHRETWYSVPELAKLVHRREESIRNSIRDGYLEATRHRVDDPRRPQLFVKGSAWHAFATQTYIATLDLQDRLSLRQLRHCDERTGEIDHTRIVDVWETGVRSVFKVTLANGYALKMTKDHRCLTTNGWKTLEQATGVHLGIGGGTTWRSDAPEFAVNGVMAHRDRQWLAARRGEGLSVQEMADSAGVSYHTIRKALAREGLQFSPRETAVLSGRTQRHRDIHRMNLELALLDEVGVAADLSGFWSRHERSQPRHPLKRRPAQRKLVRSWSAIDKIEYAGEEMTYDLEVLGPDHNFVANGFIVHNSVNEYSARYSILDREFYVPAPELLATQATSNRQGRGDVITGERAQQILDVLRQDADRAYRDYEDLLNETASGEILNAGRPGLARELARMNLSVSFYTQWYWKTNLHNLLNFLSLRADAHAQYEIRVYADALIAVLKDWVPHTHAAFMDYRMGAYGLSAKGLAVVQRMLRGEAVDQRSSGMSPGEWRELMATLQR